MKNAYTEKELIKTFKLNGYDMERIIVTEGKIFVALNEGCVYLHLPSLDAYVIYPAHLHQKLIQKLQPAAYKLSLEDTLIKVTSSTNYPSSFLLTDFMLTELNNHIDISDDILFMTSTRPQVPLFIGRSNVIERLADGFDSLDGMMSINDFLTWKEAYVRP